MEAVINNSLRYLSWRNDYGHKLTVLPSYQNTNLKQSLDKSIIIHMIHKKLEKNQLLGKLFGFVKCMWTLIHLINFSSFCSFSVDTGHLEGWTSPVLHTGGERVHAGRHSTNGETWLDGRVWMEKHRLDDIQNIRVSEEEHRQVHQSSRCNEWIQPLSYVCVWLKCPDRFSGSRDLRSVLWWDQDYFWRWKWQALSVLCGDCITAICRTPHPGDSTNRRDFPPEALWLSRKEDRKCCRWEAEKVSQLSGPGSYGTHLPMKLCIVIVIICIFI